MTEAVCTRLLDVPLRLVADGATNLGHFCGQKLVVVFCPDPEAAALEIASYQPLASAFEHVGAWLVAVLENAGAAGVPAEAGSFMQLGFDPDGSALLALARMAPDLDFDVRAGATFVIDRDGTIRTAWPGVGHAARALEIAAERP